MSTIHMIGVSPGKRIHAVRNVRAARKTLGDVRGAQLKESLESVDRLLAEPEVPVLIGRHADPATVALAASQIERDDVGRALIDLSPEQVFNKDEREKREVRSTDSEPEFSREEYATAMNLLAMTGGNPSLALMAANTLMRCTGDAEFFDAVGDVLLATFPSEDVPA